MSDPVVEPLKIRGEPEFPSFLNFFKLSLGGCIFQRFYQLIPILNVSEPSSSELCKLVPTWEGEVSLTQGGTIPV